MSSKTTAVKKNLRGTLRPKTIFSKPTISFPMGLFHPLDAHLGLVKIKKKHMWKRSYMPHRIRRTAIINIDFGRLQCKKKRHHEHTLPRALFWRLQRYEIYVKPTANHLPMHNWRRRKHLVQLKRVINRIFSENNETKVHIVRCSKPCKRAN